MELDTLSFILGALTGYIVGLFFAAATLFLTARWALRRQQNR